MQRKRSPLRLLIGNKENQDRNQIAVFCLRLSLSLNVTKPLKRGVQHNNRDTASDKR